MLAEYRAAVDFDGWRQVVNVVPLSDFRMQHRTRWGGYGDLPSVAEGADYQPLTSPTDEEATYKAGKKGGTEDVTLEMIKNDDVGAIRRIPTKLSRAAKRTLAKFVFDFFRPMRSSTTPRRSSTRTTTTCSRVLSPRPSWRLTAWRCSSRPN